MIQIKIKHKYKHRSLYDNLIVPEEIAGAKSKLEISSTFFLAKNIGLPFLKFVTIYADDNTKIFKSLINLSIVDYLIL